MGEGHGQGQGHDLQGEWAIKELRQPGIEPGSAAWKATMLTITPLTLGDVLNFDNNDQLLPICCKTNPP